MMTETFDPYQKWLGIPPHQQPPNPYRLLGVELFERDPEVIERAADRQTAYLRGFQAGPHADACRSLLNEIASARYSLLDDQQKSAIDRRLKDQMAALPPGSAAPNSRSPSRGVGDEHGGLEGESENHSQVKSASGRKKSRGPLRRAKPLDANSPPATSGGPSPRGAAPIPVHPPSARPDLTASPANGPVAGVSLGDPGTVAATRSRRSSGRKQSIEIAKVAIGGVVGLALGLLILWFGFRQQFQQLLGGSTASGNPATSSDPLEPVVPRPDNDRPAESRPQTRDPFELVAPGEAPQFAARPTLERPDWLTSGDPDVYGIRDVPSYELEDLDRVMTLASQAAPIADRIFDREVSLSADEQRRLAREMYDAFCELADVVTFSDFGQAPVQAHLANLETMLRKIGDTDQKRRALAFVAQERWQEAAPSQAGMLLAGKIEAIEALPRLYRTQVRLAIGKGPAVSIYSWKDPALFCSAGDTVVALGRLVDQPTKNLAGYDGSEPRVVWGGYLVTP